MTFQTPLCHFLRMPSASAAPLVPKQLAYPSSSLHAAGLGDVGVVRASARPDALQNFSTHIIHPLLESSIPDPAPAFFRPLIPESKSDRGRLSGFTGPNLPASVGVLRSVPASAGTGYPFVILSLFRRYSFAIHLLFIRYSHRLMLFSSLGSGVLSAAFAAARPLLSWLHAPSMYFSAQNSAIWRTSE